MAQEFTNAGVQHVTFAMCASMWPQLSVSSRSLFPAYSDIIT